MSFPFFIHQSRKQRDRLAYLHKTLEHKTSLKNNASCGQGLRLNIISKEKDYQDSQKKTKMRLEALDLMKEN